MPSFKTSAHTHVAQPVRRTSSNMSDLFGTPSREEWNTVMNVRRKYEDAKAQIGELERDKAKLQDELAAAEAQIAVLRAAQDQQLREVRRAIAQLKLVIE